MSVVLAIVVGLVIGLATVAMLVMFIYNKLVILRNRYKNAFTQIDVQLKLRYDLIPNLVEATKGYMQHESSTLEAVIKARSQATAARESAAGDPTQAAALQRLAGADSALSGALGRLMMVMEQYPDLKANQTVAHLMEEIGSVEKKVSFARQAYNDSVMFYNQSREVFPTVLFANVFGFGPAEFWQLENRAEYEDAPKISLTK